MGGNSVWPNSSTGRIPFHLPRSSSTYCAKRDRLATTRIVSSSSWRMKARTRELPAVRNSIVPRPNAWYCLRSAMRRLVHQSSELGLFCCASTLIAS